MKIKVVAYESTGKVKGRVQNIKNIDKLEFSETANGGQGNFNIELGVKFDDFTYEEGDFIEYSVFSDKYKEGLHKYTGVVKGVERSFTLNKGESVKLLVEGLVTFLSDYEFNFSFNGPLNEAINSFCSRMNGNVSISNTMQYLGNTIFKNGVTNTDNVNVNVSNKKALEVLKEIFGENRLFYVDKQGYIKLVSEITRQRIITLNQNISSISINKSGEINIDLSGYEELDISIGDNIYVQNINRNLDLNGRQVQELAFGIDKIGINIGAIQNYTKFIK